MALIACKECGSNVSTEAKACPKCGAKVTKPKKPASKAWWLIGVAMVAGVVVTMSQKEQQVKQVAMAEAAKSPEQRDKEKMAKAKRDAQLQAAGAGASMLKKAMKDPTAFDLTSIVVKPSGVACYEYRAKNSFGAVMPGSAVLVSNGKLLVQEQNGNAFVTAWNKDCTAAGGDEIADMVKRLGIV